MNVSTITETRTEVELRPEVAARLIATLAGYHELCAQAKILKAQIDREKDVIGGIVTDTGYEALGIAGSKITLVRGVTTTLDKLKLLQLGVTRTQLEGATTTKPKKPYWLISGADEEDEIDSRPRRPMSEIVP